MFYLLFRFRETWEGQSRVQSGTRVWDSNKRNSSNIPQTNKNSKGKIKCHYKNVRKKMLLEVIKKKLLEPLHNDFNKTDLCMPVGECVGLVCEIMSPDAPLRSRIITIPRKPSAAVRQRIGRPALTWLTLKVPIWKNTEWLKTSWFIMYHPDSQVLWLRPTISFQRQN